MSRDWLQFTIDGPDGRVAQGQLHNEVHKIRSEYMPDLMHAAGEYMRRVVLARQFDREGGYLGAPWGPLGHGYLAWKAEHGFPSTIGERTGAMRRALTGEPTAFSMSGLSYPDSRPTSIAADPILDWSADHVTFGARVTEDGDEYTSKFSEGIGSGSPRPAFGEGQLPADVEFDLGKLMHLAVGASIRASKGIAADISGFGGPSSAMARYIGVQALRGAA